jgi:PAS domain S-box-containing protein
MPLDNRTSPTEPTERNPRPPASRAFARASERITNSELLDALGVAVYMTDAAGLITDYNEASVELWGRRPELGKDEWCGSWRVYWPDGTPMQHGEGPMALTLKENRPVRGEEAIVERPDGTRVSFVAYPTPLRDKSGALIGAVNVLVDITARKDAEHALHEHQVRLTEALAVKDEFLGLISHELRTPITTILGNARVLTRETSAIGEDDRRAALDDIVAESERLRAIVADLLVLARAENGKRFDSEPLAVGRLVEECVEGFRRKYPGRRFEFAADYGPVANADRTYVWQVITNLLSNAVKYGQRDASVDIEVFAEGSEVRVHVRDRGVGIGDDERDRVFEPFYRSPATALRASGVGVGLTVCRRLVQAMGGDMWAIGRDGGGADVGFWLPQVDTRES